MALVDDLIQETYLKICGDRRRLLSEFQPHHPEAFYGYLKVITANVVHDHFRAQYSHKRGSGRTETSIGEPFSDMPATVTVGEDIHRQILLKEVDAALCAGTPDEKQARDRIIFWLYYRYGLTAQAIARLPSISLTVKGVESVIHNLTRSVRERLAERITPYTSSKRKAFKAANDVLKEVESQLSRGTTWPPQPGRICMADRGAGDRATNYRTRFRPGKG